MRVCLKADHNITGTLLGPSTRHPERVRLEWDDQGDLADLVDTINQDAIMPLAIAQTIDQLRLLQDSFTLQIECAISDLERIGKVS